MAGLFSIQSAKGLVRVLSVVFLLAGCQTYPYMEIGMGYYHRGTPRIFDLSNGGTVRTIPGTNPSGHFNAGLEFDWNDGRSWVDRCEYHHESDLFVSGLNELTHNEFICYAKWSMRGRGR